MDATQRLDWDDEEDAPANRDQPVGNLHMFAGGYGPAQDFPIYPGHNVIGRHSSCDITLPAQSVSKKHAVLEVNGTCHTICDNNSLNKTRRNKTALNPHVHYALTDGEFLMFADVTCRYSILKPQLDSTAAEESEDDSVMIPGTQGALAIEKTPAVAIRRMGGGTVLARDSGDEEEEDVVRRERNDAGAGGTGDAQKTWGPEAGATVPSATDTIVPESDEEVDTSTNQEPSPSSHPPCDSEADDHENSRRSSFIPSSLDTFLSPAPKEKAKVERESQSPVTQEERPVGGQEKETDTSPIGKDSSDDGRETEAKTAKTVANDSLPQGGGNVFEGSSDGIPDAGSKDGVNNVINLSVNVENNVKNLKNDTAKNEPPEVTSTIKDSRDETSKPDDVHASSTDAVQKNDNEAKEDNKNPLDNDLKITAEADFCLNSDTDVDDEGLSISILDVKQMEEPESKPDVEQEDTKAAEPSGTGVHQNSDSTVDEDKEAPSGVVSKQETSEIHLESDTDVEDDTEPAKNVNVELNAANNNNEDGVIHDADTIPEAIVSASPDNSSNADVEDADVTRSDMKKAALDSMQAIEEKEAFHLDSDTDVEDDADLSSKEVKKDDSDSKATDISLEETKESVHLDHDTDVEDTDVSSSKVPKEKDSGTNVQEGEDDLHLDSDTDVDEDDQNPRSSSIDVDIGPMPGSHIDQENIETSALKKDEPAVPDEKGAGLQIDSDTDVDEDDEPCSGPGVKKVEGTEGLVKSDTEKTESKARNEDAALHIDSDTDVDEEDGSLVLDKVETAEVASHSEVNGTSEKDSAAGALREESNSISVESSVEEKESQISDSEGDDDMMATQCYIDPPEVESDLPEEEEATQAYILSSTLAEPDPFKRPLDPIGVLQISAVTLDRSDEDIDENAIAETQLFCHDAGQSVDLGIVQTPQLGEETAELEEATQLINLEESPRKDDQELPQGVISQGDTEPVSQCLSSTAPKETGTWLHLKRDVPASVWVKNIQKEGETSSVNEIVNQDDDSTQVDEVLPLELEATQSYILEAPTIPEHPSLDNVSPQEEDSTQVVEELPRLELEATQSFLLDDPAVQEQPTQANVPTQDSHAEELSRLELETTQSFLLETPTVEENATQDNLSHEEDSTQVEDKVPRLELEATQSSILEVPVVREHLAQDEVQSVPEGDAKPIEFTGQEIEGHSTEASKTDLKANEDDATQTYDQTFPLSDIEVPQHNLQEQSKDDVAQSTNLIIEHTEGAKTQADYTADYMAESTAEVKEETKLPSKEKPPTRRGLSRNKKKEEEPEKGAEIPVEICELQDGPPIVPELVTVETAASESGQSGPVPQVSETREEDEPEKGRRRGGRRKAAEALESNTTTKDDVVAPAPTRKRTNKMASEAESSTSVKVTAKEQKEEPGSSLEQLKDSVASGIVQNIPQTTSLRSENKNDNIPESTSLEKSEEQMNKENENAKNHNSTSVMDSGSGNQISSTSRNDTESGKSKVTDLQVESKSVSVLDSKKPIRGNRRVAAKAKNNKVEETESKDIAEKTVTETRDTDLVKQVDIKKLTSRTSESQAGEGGRKRTTSRRANAQPTESVEKEKDDVEDITSQTDVDKNHAGDQSSGTTRSKRAQRNVKEEAKEDSQTKEKVGRLPPKRGNQKNEEKNNQEMIDKLPQKTQKHSKDVTPKTQEMVEIGNPDEGATVQQSKKTGRNSKAEQKIDGGDKNQESSSTTETQGTRRTKRGQEEVVPDKEEAVKEASARRTRKNQKADEDTLVNEQRKRSARISGSKEGAQTEAVVKDMVVESKKDTVDQKAPRRTGRNLKEDEKTGMEHVPDTTQDNSKSERSSKTRKNTVTEKDRTVEKTETKEECGESTKDTNDEDLSTQEDKPRRGRSTKASPKEELPEVSTPVTSRKRGRPSKADVELKRKKSEETEGAVEEKPTGRRGRVSETKPAEEDSKSERSTRTKRRSATEDNEGLPEKTEAKEELDESTKDREDEELSTKEDKPRRGRSAKPSPKEELSQVTTAVTSRKRGQTSKADVEVKKNKLDDTETEKDKPTGRRGRVSETKPAQENIKSERSRTRRNTETEDSQKILEKTSSKEEFEGKKDREDEELSTPEDKRRRGRSTRASPNEELSQVSTPVTSKKRGQASKPDVEVKRKKSDETEEAKEEKPTSRKGRPRKLATTDDAQTGIVDGKKTPEPSPSRSSRQRPSSSTSSNSPELQTPRRTNRLSAAAAAASTSPYVPPSGPPPKVLFTGVVDETGEQIIRSLGGEIADSVFDCTHLITDRVRRTVKFLCALARGIPIVTLDWIDKCKKSGCFLSPAGFLVSDKEQEKNFSFVLSESLLKAKKRPLFEGYEIHVTPSVKPEPEHMRDIIRCSGATYLPKMPRTFKEKCVIVSCTEDAARCKSVPSRVPITSAEFILSGILRQEANPAVYLLNSTEGNSVSTPAKRRR